jgi:hypothetical protein
VADLTPSAAAGEAITRPYSLLIFSPALRHSSRPLAGSYAFTWSLPETSSSVRSPF